MRGAWCQILSEKNWLMRALEHIRFTKLISHPSAFHSQHLCCKICVFCLFVLGNSCNSWQLVSFFVLLGLSCSILQNSSSVKSLGSFLMYYSLFHFFFTKSFPFFKTCLPNGSKQKLNWSILLFFQQLS